MADSTNIITLQSWGQKIVLETGEDLTSNTGLKLIFKNPAGTTVEKTASTDAVTGGDIYWVSTTDFFSSFGTAGNWYVTAKVTWAAAVLYSRPVLLRVVDQWSD
jgi:hypothetical protein